MNVFDLAAKLTLDSSEYDNGLNGAAKNASAFGGKIKTAFKVGGAAIAATSAAITGVSVAFVKGAGDVASYGDNIDKMSQKMGLSAQAYQEWDAVMQHSGTSIESLRSGMKTLANAVENGNEAFARLGITEEQIQSLNNEELFSATITALQNVENETERTYLAGQLLGRGATELGALLNTSAEDTQAMKDRVHELGGVMSDEAVKAAARYTDSLQDMQTAFSGIKRGIMTDMLPAITTIMDGLTEFAANEDGSFALDSIKKGIDDIANKIAKKLPKVLKFAGKFVSMMADAIISNLPTIVQAGLSLITALGEGIIDNLPTIMDTAVQVITMLSSYIIESLPTLLKAGVQILLSLAQGITQALPELIPTIVDVVLQIVDTLTDPDNIGAFIDAAIALMLGLANGMLDAAPRIIEKIPEIIQNLVDAIVDNVPKLVEAGIQLFVAMVSNLPAIIAGIVQALPEIINSIVTGLGDLHEKLGAVFAKAWEGLKGAFSGAGEWFKDTFNDAKERAAEAWANAKDKFAERWESIKTAFAPVTDWFKDKFSKAKEAASDAWNGVKNLFLARWGEVKDAFTTTVTWFKEKFTNAKTAAVNAWSNIKEKMSEVWGKIREAFETNEALKWALDLVTNFIKGIRDSLTQLWNIGKDAVNAVWEGIKSLNPAEWGKDLINNFTSGISKAWETGKGAVSNVASSISKLLGFSEPEEGPLSNFHTYAPDMMKLFAQGVRDNTGIVTDAVESAFNFEPKIRAGFDSNGNYIGRYDDGPQTIIVQSVLDGRVIGENAYRYSRGRLRAAGG